MTFHKYILVLSLLLALSVSNAQIAPTAQPVYGGYIEEIEVIALNSTTSRVFISTLSANSLFYADVTHGGSVAYGAFSTIPDLDMDDNFGFSIRAFTADETTGYIFAATGTPDGIIACNTSAGSQLIIDPIIAEDILAIQGKLFYVFQNGSDLVLRTGTIGAGASVSGISDITVAPMSAFTERPLLMYDANNDKILVFGAGTPPVFYQSSDIVAAINASSSFSALSTSGLTKEYLAAGISPAGRIFVGGYQGHSGTPYSYIAYSDDYGTSWTEFDLPGVDAGRGSPYLTVAGTTGNYYVYYGRAFSNYNGNSGSWAHLPGTTVGGRVMDGPVRYDPNDQNVIYFRTDWGIGASSDRGSTIEEINTGITAVQVDGFAMDETKNTAWVASKSGIWKATNYQTSPSWLSTPFWPNYDTTPYRTVATTKTGDTVYVGNQSGRAFKYCSNFGALDNTNFSEIFSADSFGSTYGSFISAIAPDPYSSTERLFIGVFDEMDSGETTDDKGGLFVGEYTTSWNWTEITGSAIPSNGVDILDIVVTQENGNTVIYAGAEYFYDATHGTSRSIYRCEDTGSGWNVTQDMLNATQNISASIYDLTITSSGKIYACGTNATGTHPVIYSKDVGDSVWTVLTSGGSGLPPNEIASSITVDESTGDVYIAIKNEIYILTSGSTAWGLYYTYPAGTAIQFIYYDDLMVGTETGLYDHSLATDIPKATLTLTNAREQSGQFLFDVTLTRTNDWGTANNSNTLGDSSLIIISKHRDALGASFPQPNTNLFANYDFRFDPMDMEDIVVTIIDKNHTGQETPINSNQEVILFTNSSEIVNRQKDTELRWDGRSFLVDGDGHQIQLTLYNLLSTGPIPVELQSFQASVNENTILLNWVTSTETNNYGFEVERYNRNSWEKVGFVKGNGTTTNKNTYSFSETLPTGDYNYRLKQLDFDGSYSYSETLNISVGIPATFALQQNYPNPFNATTTISFSLPEEQCITLELYDITGQKLMTLMQEQLKPGYYSINLNANNLATGIYIYKLHTNQFISTKKMLLLK